VFVAFSIVPPLVLRPVRAATDRVREVIGLDVDAASIEAA